MWKVVCRGRIKVRLEYFPDEVRRYRKRVGTGNLTPVGTRDTRVGDGRPGYDVTQKEVFLRPGEIDFGLLWYMEYWEKFSVKENEGDVHRPSVQVL